MHGDLRAQLLERGYAGPVRVLEEQRCRQIVDRLNDSAREPPDWHKGCAVNAWAYYDIARNPAIVDRVAAGLGEEVMLWGASLQTRAPDAVHPWHTDIEIQTAWGRSVSVWIGLEHTAAASSLLLMPGSHRFGVTVQETAHRFGKRRREIRNEDILAWAAEHEPQSRIAQVEMSDGEALLFDGALWHGSHNLTRETRQALLLQYAVPALPIRIADFGHLEWPVRLFDSPRPPCIMVRGAARGDANRIVAPPARPASPDARKLANRVYPLRVPLAPDEDKGWKAYPIFRGSTAALRALTCHASVLTHDQCPHPPHRHDEDEILMVLSGEVDIEVPDLDGDAHNGRLRLRAGQFAYYPAQFAHTLRTVSEEPANYVMLKWQGGPGSQPRLSFGRFDALAPVAPPSPEKGFRTRLLFDGPTASLRKLHGHASQLLPGAGYEAHVDAHDVAIVVLEGEVETLGERVKPFGVIFYPAGQSHGMTNPGATPARYVVFEFHGEAAHGARTAGTAPAPTSMDPRRWARAVKRWLAGR